MPKNCQKLEKKNYLKNTYNSSFSCAPSMSSYDFPVPS